MRSGSHVQLAALRNRDLELQTASPFSNHGSLERSTACFRHKNVLVLLGFQKFPFFLCHPVLQFIPSPNNRITSQRNWPSNCLHSGEIITVDVSAICKSSIWWADTMQSCGTWPDVQCADDKDATCPLRNERLYRARSIFTCSLGFEPMTAKPTG